MSMTQRKTTFTDTWRTFGRVIKSGTFLYVLVFLMGSWEVMVKGLDLTVLHIEISIEPILNPVFFAAPSEIYPEIRDLYESGILATALWASVMRVVYGFVIGAVPAILLGLLMGSVRWIYVIFQPLAEALYATPKIAFLPLILFLYGTGEKGLVRIVALSVFFLVLLSVVKYVQQIDPKYREIARSFGANPLQIFFSVTLPASMPGIVTSLQLGMGFALVVIIGTEFLAASGNVGIGYEIWQAKEVFNVIRYFAGLIIVGVMGYGLALLLTQIGKLMLPWVEQKPYRRPTYLQQRLSLYWRAMRPWSFVATLVPYLLGSVVAAYEWTTRYYKPDQILSLASRRDTDIEYLARYAETWAFNWWIFGLAMIGAVAFQAGTNLVNDYYDHIKGADNEDSLGIGGVIQRGELSARFVLFYGLSCFAVGSIIGLYMVSVTDEFILYLGIFSFLAGFFYTAGPFALAYMRLGELTVGIFMGPVIVIGAFYIQFQVISLTPILASLPIALLVASILHVNNLRDLENDRAVGKRTLATLVGRPYANIEYYILVGGAYLMLVLLIIFEQAPIYTLIAFITFPSALSLMYRVAAHHEPAMLNPVLRRTAQLHMRFGLLMVGGWFFGIIETAYRIAQN